MASLEPGTDAPPISWQGRAADALRRLMLASVTSDLVPEEVYQLERLASRMQTRVNRSRFRVDAATGQPVGERSPWALATNVITGPFNPVAPPMDIEMQDGVAVGTGVFGPVYEGAPGCVHGGSLASVMESLLPRPAAPVGPRLTGTMTVRYRKPTPIGVTVRLRAELVSIEGRKARTAGTISVGDQVCVEGDAIVIAVATGAIEDA